jgi:hypothetical protein
MNISERNIHQKLVKEIKSVLSTLPNKLLIEKQNGIGLIQAFSEVDMIEGDKNKFKIAFLDMLLLDENNKPFLVIEPETSSSSKTFGRSIPVYTIAKLIKTRGVDYKVESPLILMIVIPDDKNYIKKMEQLDKLKNKIKKAINFRKSQLKDFSICQISDFKESIRKLLEVNGHNSYLIFFKDEEKINLKNN